MSLKLVDFAFTATSMPNETSNDTSDFGWGSLKTVDSELVPTAAFC